MKDEIDAKLAAVRTEAEQLRSRLSEGTVSEGTQLDKLISELMSSLHAAPKELGKSYLPALTELASTLDELTADFKRQQGAAEEAMQLINTRLKAATAYAKTSASSKG